MAVTGGGSGAISELLRVPGASRTLFEAVVPYSASALRDWLGAKPEQACSARTARAMAMTAFTAARRLAEGNAERVAGIGCTASLASDRPKRGPHRVHVAWQSTATTATASLELTKGLRSRPAEEEIAAWMVLNAIAEAAELAERLPLDLANGEEVAAERTDAPADWQNLMLGRRAAIRFGHEHADVQQSRVRAVFPGAFNPLHEGHREMAAVGCDALGVDVHFEISIENVDKPPLDYTEMAHRSRQFAADEALWFTRAPTFVAKAAIFPGATFLVGADTIVRIADPAYYGGDMGACQEAIRTIGNHGCRFLVFGRQVAGRFLSLADLKLPPKLVRLCQDVPAERFRRDISSTELRERAEREGPS